MHTHERATTRASSRRTRSLLSTNQLCKNAYAIAVRVGLHASHAPPSLPRRRSHGCARHGLKHGWPTRRAHHVNGSVGPPARVCGQARPGSAMTAARLGGPRNGSHRASPRGLKSMHAPVLATAPMCVCVYEWRATMGSARPRPRARRSFVTCASASARPRPRARRRFPKAA